MRTFAAIVPPFDVIADINEITFEWMRRVGRRSKPDPHITLAFWEDIDQEQAGHQTREATLHNSPFELQLGGAGMFEGRQTTLWIGVAAGLKPLNDLAADFGPTERKFSPHLTLTRVQRKPRGLPFIPATRAFTVDSVTLFESELTRRGAIHTAVGKYPLLG